MSKKTKHKKHKKAHSRSSNKKEAEAIQRKLFLKSFKTVMEAWGVSDLYGTIPPEEKKTFTRIRFRSVRIEVEQGSQVNRQDLRLFRGITSFFLKEIRLPFGQSNHMISIHDYFTAGYTFMSFFRSIDTTSFEGADRLKDAANELHKFMAKENNPFEFHLANYIHHLLFLTSRPDRQIYTARTDTIQLNSGGKSMGLSVCIYFRSEKPEKCQVILENKKRIAYRVGVPGKSRRNIAWGKIPHNRLVPDYSGKHEQLNMYIQSHALRRFDERIRGLDSVEFLRLSLNYSLLDQTIAEYKDGKGLLVFNHMGKKFGYFVFTIINDMLVIRTFLFLTNSGTPEGRKIDKLLGIRKIDKQYLQLDTAYTFLHTDILNSPWLCDLLVEAGCEQICDMVTDSMEDKRKTGYALDTARYLGLPETVYSELV